MCLYSFYYIQRRVVNELTPDPLHTLPPQVENYAFNGCLNLTDLALPPSVEVGAYAFNGCAALSKLAAAAGMTAVQYVRSRWSPPPVAATAACFVPNGYNLNSAQQAHEQQMLNWQQQQQQQQQSFSPAPRGHYYG